VGSFLFSTLQYTNLVNIGMIIIVSSETRISIGGEYKMTNRFDSGNNKLHKRMLKEAKRWAKNRGVKHKGMDFEDLQESFEKEGFTLDFSQNGAEIDVWLIQTESKKIVLEGKVELDMGLTSDDTTYEGD
jgi:hypothetical protein